jgi:hypothetical protein
LITTSLLKSVNLYQSTSFAYPKKLISYQRNQSIVEFYFLPEDITTQQWNTATFEIETIVFGDEEYGCEWNNLFVDPFTITYKNDDVPDDTPPDDPPDDPPVVTQELPGTPELYSIGVSTASEQVTLKWRKVIDSSYHHNADHYIIEYRKQYNEWDSAQSVNAGNPSTESNVFETLTYAINGLVDDRTYYFRVKAVNNAGDSDWSNVQSIKVDIEDLPFFMLDHFPDDGELNVSKTPELRWWAHDNDGDTLDYYVTLRESGGNWKTLRSFKDPEHQGEETFNFSNEYDEPLKPDTGYEWQIWVRESGRTRDYYGGEYIKSEIHSFTTINTGADPCIVDVEQVGEIKPDSEVLFKVTVKNNGTESVASQLISTSYIKNDQESPFWDGAARTSTDLEPNQSVIIDLYVRFMDNIWNKNGVSYDNVLSAGTSQIRFFFAQNNEQDIDLSNNTYLTTIEYVDMGGPVLEKLYIREHYNTCYGPKCSNANYDFWARAGQDISINISAVDDVRVQQVVLQAKYALSDNYQELKNWTHDDDDFYANTKWSIPDDIQTTDEAQIRVLLYDNQNNETIKETACFSIYSNNINASIAPLQAIYKEGNILTYAISNTSDHAISNIDVGLCLGSYCDNIIRLSDNTGLSLQTSYEWTIPTDNQYVSQNLYLKMEIIDVRGNSKEVISNTFAIEANTELPAPFGQSISMYDEEFSFPVDASETYQSINVIFLKIDTNNIAHAIVTDNYSYRTSTSTYVDNKYYITYNQTTDKVSEKVFLCDKNYKIIDFELIENVPYVILEKREVVSRTYSWYTNHSLNSFNQYYYTYKNGSSFVSPINLINPTVPRVSKAIDQGTGSSEVSGDIRIIFGNGYLWRLDLGNYIYRYSFSDGQIGSEERIRLAQRYDLECYDINPTYDSNIIYFIDRSESKLAMFNTLNNAVNEFDLPFTIGSRDDDIADKTAIAAMNGKVFIFGNGKVYTLQNNTITELIDIVYTYGSDTVNYFDNWSDVDSCKAIRGNGLIYLILDLDYYYNSKPQSAAYEILEYNPNTNQFSKKVIETSEDSYDRIYFSDGLYINNNKAIMLEYDQTIRMINFDTGEIYYLGDPSLNNMENTFLIEQNNTHYVIGNRNYRLCAASISLNNISTQAKQVIYLQFVKRNNELYVTWVMGGNPYNGLWDESKQQTISYASRVNQFQKIYPQKENVNNFSNSYLSKDQINLSDNYLSFPRYGKLYALNSELTVSELILESNLQSIFVVNNFNPDLKAVFSNYNGTFHLIGEDPLTPNEIIMDTRLYKVELASYTDELLLVGKGQSGTYSGKYVILKYDLASQQSTMVGLKNNVRDYSQKKVDINENKYVAVAWDNFIAVADFSGDVVSPTVNISANKQKIANGETLTLNWEASDNKDELVRFEIFKKNTLVSTIDHISTTRYEEVVNEQNGLLTYKIKAYDYDGNIGIDTIDIDVFTPVSFNAFSVNKTSLELGEKLIFTWTTNNADESTNYTVYRKKSGSSDWISYFSVTGDTDFMIIVDGFIGDYQFMIGADDNVMELNETVHIDGEMVEFNADAFSDESLKYYLEIPEIILTWGINGNLSEIVSYDLYVKHQGASQFHKIVTTTDCQYNYLIPESMSKQFEWQVQAQFRGDTYESQIFQTRLEPLHSPDVTSVELFGRNSLAPSTVITFTPVAEIQQYAIMRRDNDGNYFQIGQSESGVYTDTTVQYDKQYEYSVCSITDQLFGDPSGSKSIDVTIEPVRWITIENASHTILESSAITIHYFPNSNDCFERYEIWFGNQPDELQAYTITSQRSITFDAISYGAYKYVQIFALDYKNDQVTYQPAQVSFERPFNTSRINIKITDISASEAVVSWVSSTDSMGMVRYGSDVNDYQNWQTVTDSRGENVLDELHYVELQALHSNTDYYFEVISGSKKDNNNGQYYHLKTGPALSNMGSCQVTGKIFSDAAQTLPVDHAIVYITILGDGDSSTGSFLVTPETNGRWWTELVNFRTSDHQKFYTNCCEENNILIEVEAGHAGSDQMITLAKHYTPEQPDSELQSMIPEQNHTISISSGDHGIISPSGQLDIRHHSDITIHIMPDDGYHISAVYTDGQPTNITTTYTLTQISTDRSFTATFAKNTFIIETQSGSGGQIIAPSSVKYSEDCYISIVPDTDYHVNDVRVDGISFGNINDYTLTNIIQDHVISAIFEINAYSITTSAGPNGKISPSGLVTHGNSYTVTISPDDGFYIFSVFLDGENIGQPLIHVFEDVTEAHELFVEFHQYSYSINASTLVGGSITNDGVSTVLWGESLNYSIQANDEYIIYDILIDNISNGPMATYQFSSVKRDHSIQAVFAAEYHLYPGWNLISLSLEPETPLNAKDWAEEINSNGGDVDIVQAWNGKWSTYNVGAPFNFFDIEMGRGYFIRCNRESTWINVGQEWNISGYHFQEGYNLFGFPFAQSLMASELANLINDDQPYLIKIQQWTGSGFGTYSINAPFTDYPLSHLNGYFLLFTDTGYFEINP